MKPLSKGFLDLSFMNKGHFMRLLVFIYISFCICEYHVMRAILGVCHLTCEFDLTRRNPDPGRPTPILPYEHRWGVVGFWTWDFDGN